MFYVKTKINDEATIKTEITDENVFTVCPECGAEFPVDLHEVFENGGELYGTAVHCPSCAAVRHAYALLESIGEKVEFIEENAPFFDDINEELEEVLNRLNDIEEYYVAAQK